MLLLPALIVFAVSLNGFAQEAEQATVKKINFEYSQNPKTRKKPETAEKTNVAPVSVEINVPLTEINQNAPENKSTETPVFESRSIASKTTEIAKRSTDAAISPTEIYKIGVGDVLFISLQNAPAKASTYFTVLNDGTIDYALAGEMVPVASLTAEEVEDLLKQKVKIYENPQISVKVREHASHSITVLGMVEKAGEKFLQREAMPLFVVKAEAVVQPKVNLAIIKRASAGTEKIDLSDAKSDDVLIFPGDIVEFKSAEIQTVDQNAPQFYFIGGSVSSGGQKDFHQGITLTQSILASGGLKNQNVRRIVIRRKNLNGLLSPFEFDLVSIKNGKQPDPVLQAGDTIEVGN